MEVGGDPIQSVFWHGRETLGECLLGLLHAHAVQRIAERLNLGPLEIRGVDELHSWSHLPIFDHNHELKQIDSGICIRDSRVPVVVSEDTVTHSEYHVVYTCQFSGDEAWVDPSRLLFVLKRPRIQYVQCDHEGEKKGLLIGYASQLLADPARLVEGMGCHVITPVVKAVFWFCLLHG